MQQYQILKNLCLIIAFSSMVITVLATCNSCQSNGLSCVNETHFKVCVDNVETDNSVLSCGANKICTSLGIGCFENVDGVEPSCTTTSNCAGCDGSFLFACTSRTTFTQCNGTTAGTEVLTCPENKVCDMNSGKFCVDECEVTTLECNKAAP
ncbi:uncharacterized protein Dwil_GK17468 [Drosophila willistoni]|uniref:DUF753 domain-containing protein n=1 Tax=Drosophila willistoni TaxID=7260 RepID=B4MMD8_DROWI|nr:uncharacterized protein LOC6638586 [Drosophila willistoni]EDW73283.1 uncharacterized protein Dwil_GK17468 [Drosophila willistoni]